MLVTEAPDEGIVNSSYIHGGILARLRKTGAAVICGDMHEHGSWVREDKFRMRGNPEMSSSGKQQTEQRLPGPGWKWGGGGNRGVLVRRNRFC